MRHTLLPVKPLTCFTPSSFAARAVFIDLLGGTPPDPFRVAVAPEPRRQDALVAVVDRIVAHALADEVRADGEALQVVLLQQVALFAYVAVCLQRLVDLEVVAPAGQLQPVESPGAAFWASSFQRKIRPLTGKEGDWPWHIWTPFAVRQEEKKKPPSTSKGVLVMNDASSDARKSIA